MAEKANLAPLYSTKAAKCLKPLQAQSLSPIADGRISIREVVKRRFFFNKSTSENDGVPAPLMLDTSPHAEG